MGSETSMRRHWGLGAGRVQLQQVRRDLVDGRSVGKHGHFGGGIRRDLRNEFVIFIRHHRIHMFILIFLRRAFLICFRLPLGRHSKRAITGQKPHLKLWASWSVLRCWQLRCQGQLFT